MRSPKTKNNPRSKQMRRDLLEVLEMKERIDDVDFSELTFINSSGMRVLLLSAKGVRAINGNLTLCGMRDSIREIFQSAVSILSSNN
ncbi:MAG: STAS domain-containing protein [Acidimicrobiia bacterium]|nr:STAS domain-containing protein [Acidimicrobiia bacterium]MXX57407.1 STAS domain-containing protein [Rhodothermaceae bacterium]MXZ05352.1 STAS domain-containing protein [Rhodothermaceae bacterium]MYD19038.1 STAS domain-containing protein [Rhodothermaceae bacterium]MYF41027.1 STAS domain-containing protein [Rhodothermaceae bacterium]